MRAMALCPGMAACSPSKRDHPPQPIQGLPKVGKGAQPEWLGKKVLAAAGIRVPDGELPIRLTKRSRRPSASAIRGSKAQAAALSHKTEAGGVI